MTLTRMGWLMMIMMLLMTPTIAQEDSDLPEDLPPITVELATAPSDGVIYLSTIQRAPAEEDETPFGQYLMVIDNEGQPVAYYDAGRSFNFGRLPDGSRYYFNFERNGPGRGASSDGSYRIIDRDFNLIRDYRIYGDDLPTQAHEFVPLDNGNVLMLSQPLLTRNLTAFGGHERALISEAVIQEFDAEDNVIFAWRSWDHVRITDTSNFAELQIAPPEAVSYMHVNAMTVDLDDNIILSARRFDELIKINRRTGEIMWRMGGGNSGYNEFTFIDDPQNGFSGQHHIQVLPNGNYLLFDNSTANSDAGSRVVEYAVDEAARTATLVWSYSDGRYAPSMGSVQRLENGNTIIGWGSAPAPNVTEVTPEGDVVFALSLPENQMSYRAYRFED